MTSENDLKPMVAAICEEEMGKGRGFFLVSTARGLAKDRSFGNLTGSRETIAALIEEWQRSKRK
jgi:hypothetical protein